MKNKIDIENLTENKREEAQKCWEEISKKERVKRIFLNRELVLKNM